MKIRRTLPGLMMLAAAWSLAGCNRPAGPPPINFYQAPAAEFQKVAQVAFICMVSSDENSEVTRELSEAVFQRIQARRLFQVDLIAADNSLCHEVDLNKRDPLSLQELSTLRKSLRCDAVLVGTVQEFQPYPRMRMSVRLRMIDLRKGKLLWGVDNVWDTTDKTVEERIKRYYNKQVTRDVQPLDWRLAMVSPKAFVKFIASETADTLPTREPVAPQDLKGKISEKVETLTKG